MHNTTTGADVFDALMEVVKKYKLPLDKLVSLATYGAPATTGFTKRVVTKLKETCKQHGNNNFEHFHCIIHQQLLFSQVLNIGHVLKIVNYIHRQSPAFLKDLESEFPDPTGVQWLSSHQVLKQISNCWTKS
ncbi:general transcription factor II-I repeat domain-containing protein 2 [Trichonephila clavipes]|nr:general transcription factor II-I repeat domain-containing protein 2 [Trichonephila clavipes]